MKRIAQDGPVAEWLERGAKLMAPKSTKSSADTSRKAWTYETGRDHDQRDQINHAHARQLIRSAQHPIVVPLTGLVCQPRFGTRSGFAPVNCG